ncbi:hypothetical protein YB2330_006637 [Saitoella coloradoensis]
MSSSTARALITIALVILFHAGYSAYEHRAFQKSVGRTAVGRLPIDIIVEALIAATIFSFGVVLSADALKPIKWREWNAVCEKEGSSTLQYLDTRPGFIDIRQRRKEYATGKTIKAEKDDVKA